uniref:Uncharacterized protein n=1 Tax=Siphoviridae sp. ctutT7 TaxID=2826506 RepID=A0A8S5MU21_9CAUD|nr:MAG TPA: hypothetical protein [Siphoviridae sp. ctutT7]
MAAAHQQTTTTVIPLVPYGYGPHRKVFLHSRCRHQVCR